MEPSIKKYEVLVEFDGSGPVGNVIDVTPEGYEVSKDVITADIAAGKIREVVEHVVTQEEVDAAPEDAKPVVGAVTFVAAPVVDKTVIDAQEPVVEEVAPVVEVEPSLVYAGKSVVRTTTREVEGRQVHSITLETGESIDVSDKEYGEMVQASLKP